MPNVISDQETRRNLRAYNTAHKDVVTATVTYADGQEHYDRIKINGSPAAASSDALNSSWSMGEFASILQMILSPMSDAEFRFSTEIKLNSIPALLFEFRVEETNNQMYYLHAFYPNGSGTTLFPAYRGKLWLNQSNNLRVSKTAIVLATRWNAPSLAWTGPSGLVWPLWGYPRGT
jgi:hypothetical protein